MSTTTQTPTFFIKYIYEIKYIYNNILLVIRSTTLRLLDRQKVVFVAKNGTINYFRPKTAVLKSGLFSISSGLKSRPEIVSTYF